MSDDERWAATSRREMKAAAGIASKRKKFQALPNEQTTSVKEPRLTSRRKNPAQDPAL